MQRWYTRRRVITTAIFAVLAIVLGVIAAVGLSASTAGITTRTELVDGIPVRMASPNASAAGPTVVIAHGFAGSSQIMGYLAESFARSGYTAISFDFAGHGANPQPLQLAENVGDSQLLEADLDAVLAWTREQPEVDPRHIALLGHSMGAGAVVAYASDARHAQGLQATIALSLPSARAVPANAPTRPANLLLMSGALEPASFAEASLAALEAAYPGAVAGQRYGDFTDGTAREAVVIPGVEHIGIVFAADVVAQSMPWLAASTGGPALPASGTSPLAWLVVALVAGCVGMVPIARLLLGRSYADSDAVPFPRWWLVLCGALAAGVIACLVARIAEPVEQAVPLSVGGYAMVWFAVAGLALLGLLWGWRRRTATGGIDLGIGPRSAAGAVAVAAYAVLVIALPSMKTWSAFALVGERWVWTLALVPAFVLYFWADESAVGGRPFWARGLLALGNRVIAVALLLVATAVLGAPGFLILVLPVMLLAFILLGVLAAIVARQRGGFLGAVLVQAIPLALLVGTAFPLVS